MMNPTLIFNLFVVLFLPFNIANPVAFHQLVTVDSGSTTLIKLTGYDPTTPNIKYYIYSLPDSGTLYQVSKYGHGPQSKLGRFINTTNTEIQNNNHQIYYKRPYPDTQPYHKWTTFSFIIDNGEVSSYPSIITLVSSSSSSSSSTMGNIIIGSNFLLTDENWSIIGNKYSHESVTYEEYSRGPLLNRYIYGTDTITYLTPTTTTSAVTSTTTTTITSSITDRKIWYFNAPTSFLGNQGVVYGGILQFTLGVFSGNFHQLNSLQTPLVELICDTCQGPVRNGIRLIYPLSNLSPSQLQSMSVGNSQVYSILLKEGTNNGWYKDPQNVLVPPIPASKCDLLQVLSRLSGLHILGDWTQGVETIALDNVAYSNTKNQVPLCAMTLPDASICTC